jgi:hypothetical protein
VAQLFSLGGISVMAKHMTKERWDAIRAKGRLRYFVSPGMLKIGIICGVISGVFLWCLVELAPGVHRLSWSLLMLLILAFALVFNVGFGFLSWHLNEKAFHGDDKDAA